MSDHDERLIQTRLLPNGYWEATVRPPWPLAVQTQSSFHDEQEALDWGDRTIRFLTSSRPPREAKP